MKDFGNICLNINPQRIHYAEAEFSELLVREVYDGDYPTGEYHLKPIKKINNKFLVDLLKEKMPGITVDVIDPDDSLGLEYPIYLKSKDRERLISGIYAANNELVEFLKKRTKGGL